MFSSKDAYLAKVWVGMPGVQTVDYNLDLKKYENINICECLSESEIFKSNCQYEISKVIMNPINVC